MSEHPKIPTTWQWSTMGEVAEIIGGGTPRTDRAEYFGGDIPWITPADLSGYTEKYISHGTRNITQAGLENSGARLMPAGTVLFSSRAPIGYVAIAANPVSTSQGFKSFVLRENINPDYVYYYLHHAKQLAVELASGTTFLEISGKKAAQIFIPVAPVNEQRRIVSEIEKQFTRLDAGVVALQRMQASFKQYRASILKSACEGSLVPQEAEIARQENRNYEPAAILLERILTGRRAHWEAEQLARMEIQGLLPLDNTWKAKYQEPNTLVTSDASELPETWVMTSLESITSAVRVICYGILMPKDNITDGVPYVKVKDFKGDRIDVERLHRTAPEIAASYSRSSLKQGDLLLAIRGTYGRVAEVPQELEGGNITQDSARLVVSPLINPRYIAWFLRSTNSQNYFKRVARGIAVRGVNIGDVRTMPIFLPPLAEQDRIVAEVERRLSVVDGLEAIVKASFYRATHLRSSILQQAFSGELVAQDTLDEPAAQILEKLQKEGRSDNFVSQTPRSAKLRMIQPNPVKTLTEMLERLDAVGGIAEPERLLVEVALGDDVDKFFELLREGKNLGELLVPVGSTGMIRRNDHAN